MDRIFKTVSQPDSNKKGDVLSISSFGYCHIFKLAVSDNILDSSFRTDCKFISARRNIFNFEAPNQFNCVPWAKYSEFF